MCTILFQQSVPHTKSLGTKEDPYDAGPTGPLCAQGGLDEEGLTNLTNIAIQDTVAGVISDIVPIPVGFTLNKKNHGEKHDINFRASASLLTTLLSKSSRR